MSYMGGASRKPKTSGLCRTDRPYIPRLEPARGALPSISFACLRARGRAQRPLGLPGKDPKRLFGGSKGAKPPWGLRAKRAALRPRNSPRWSTREFASCGLV